MIDRGEEGRREKKKKRRRRRRVQEGMPMMMAGMTFRGRCRGEAVDQTVDQSGIFTLAMYQSA